jgi:asparagine N-glycosylation enzyme membrane subunit Stt3
MSIFHLRYYARGKNDANCQSDYVQINWTTASEKDNDRFELYKSLDAKSWIKIYTIKGQGTKATDTKYTFNDTEKDENTSYYKLIDFDFNGKETLSDIISTWCNDESSETSIYPNPANDYVIVSTAWEENTMLRIITLNGVVLKEERLISSKSYVSVKDLNAGVYIFEIEKKGLTERLKLIKQ